MGRHAMLMLALLLASSAALAQDKSTPSASSPSTVVVSQGDVALTLGDIDTFAHTVPDDTVAALFDNAERIESILRNLLMSKQMATEARQMGLDQRPDVQAAIQAAKSQTLATARLQALRDSLLEQVPDLTELAREKYQANPQTYKLPATTDVKHILIATRERSDADAHALADKLYAQLLKDPSQFDADITEFSDDQSKTSNHGLIRDATSGKLAGSFGDAVATLRKPGELTAPVKTRYGYHIIKAVTIRPPKQQSFAEIKDGLVQQLQQAWVDQSVQDHVDTLRSRKIEANPELVASLRDRYAKHDKASDKSDSAAAKPAPGNSVAQ